MPWDSTDGEHRAYIRHHRRHSNINTIDWWRVPAWHTAHTHSHNAIWEHRIICSIVAPSTSSTPAIVLRTHTEHRETHSQYGKRIIFGNFSEWIKKGSPFPLRRFIVNHSFVEQLKFMLNTPTNKKMHSKIELFDKPFTGFGLNYSVLHAFIVCSYTKNLILVYGWPAIVVFADIDHGCGNELYRISPLISSRSTLRQTLWCAGRPVTFDVVLNFRMAAWMDNVAVLLRKFKLHFSIVHHHCAPCAICATFK